MLNLLEKQLHDIVAQQAERGLAALSHVGAKRPVAASRNPHLASDGAIGAGAGEARFARRAQARVFPYKSSRYILEYII